MQRVMYVNEVGEGTLTEQVGGIKGRIRWREEAAEEVNSIIILGG